MSRSAPDEPMPEPTPEELTELLEIAEDDDLRDLEPDPTDSPVIAEAKKRRRTVLLMRKIAITLVGAVVLGAGIVMLAIPGPGTLTIVLGLFILSLEYEWARRRFDQLRDKTVEAAHVAAANKLGTALSVISALAMVVGGMVWARQEDWPFSSWWTGGSVSVGGALGLVTIAWAMHDLRRTRAKQTAQDLEDSD